MSQAWLVVTVFALSCAVTLVLLLHRPYLRIRVFQRRLRVETYFLGALLGPVLVLSLGLLTWPQVIRGLNGTTDLQPLGILSLFLSMVFISIFLDITGVFEFCARAALRWAGADGRRLFLAVYATVSGLTIFTSNDIIILTFTPLVYHFARHGRLNPVPYLVAEFFAANTWSLLLPVGNPTNIVLTGVFRLPFLDYAARMLLPTLAAGMVQFGALAWIFRREIRRPLEHHAVGRPMEAITDRPGAIMGLLLLASCVAALAVAPRHGIPMWPVALSAAIGLLAVLIARRSWARLLGRDSGLHGGAGVRHTLGRMPWGMVPFALSMFVTVAALRQYGITPALGRFVRDAGPSSPGALVWIFGYASALSANLLNNIPMTIAFSTIIGELSGAARTAAVFATTVGSNLGANITPLGALAGLLWIGILRDKGLEFRFRDFMYYGLLITPLTLAAALGVLALQFAR